MFFTRDRVLNLALFHKLEVIEDAIPFADDEYWGILLYKLSEYGNSYRLFLCKDNDAYKGRWYELPQGLLPIFWIERMLEERDDSGFFFPTGAR